MWFLDSAALKHHAINFFSKLYSSPREALEEFPIYHHFPKISPENMTLLSKDISDLEIKGALFDMKPFKAPGVDGLHNGWW